MTLNEITSLPPDTSATDPEHMIGFRAGWRAAMDQVRRELYEVEGLRDSLDAAIDLMTDTPALLPPDPSKPGRYWLRTPNGLEVIANFRCGSWLVMGQPTYYGARFMREQGYTLAIPHPIPGPAALEAVYRLLSHIDDAARISDFLLATAMRDRLRAALETKETT